MSGPTALEAIVSWRCGENEPTPDDWAAAESLVRSLEDAGYRIVPYPNPTNVHEMAGGLEVDADGHILAPCVCGWISGAYLSSIAALDALKEHAFQAALSEM